MDANQQYISDLQKELEKRRLDHDALRAELHASNGQQVDKPSAVVKKALIDKVPTYIKNIHDLAEASESESVRLSANKLLVEWAITNKLDVTTDDADESFKQLLSLIKAKARS